MGCCFHLIMKTYRVRFSNTHFFKSPFFSEKGIKSNIYRASVLQESFHILILYPSIITTVQRGTVHQPHFTGKDIEFQTDYLPKTTQLIITDSESETQAPNSVFFLKTWLACTPQRHCKHTQINKMEAKIF